MGRRPCCSKEDLNRGAWTALEDKILTAYIKVHGEGKWRNLPKKAGLKRCGKSCRLRWLNYLRPDIKRGNISHDEEDLIVRLHKLLGNRWSLIAGRLPGRTDNEIKNYWNTTLGKKATAARSSPSMTSKPSPPCNNNPKTKKLSDPENPNTNSPKVIRTKATRCTRVLITPLLQAHEAVTPPHHDSSKPPSPTDVVGLQCDNGDELQARDRIQDPPSFEFDYENDFPAVPQDSILGLEGGCWSTNLCLEDSSSLDLESLAFLLDSDDWA